ncbi:Retrovirus-related Pol polyprotein from transposon [Ceratobasidium sp. AG-Ba]|nr:Retrovirus-related Pol polyprotein from transposon [Ceratobasidium sp. AG-Ba]
MNQFMHTRWFNDQVYKKQRMRFRDSKHEDEKPLAYVIRKKLHMQLLQPQTFDILIYEIMAGAPTAWAQILRVEELDGQWTTFVSRVQQYEDLLIEAKYQEKSGQIMRCLERLEKNSHNRHSHARVAHPEPHKSKGKDANGLAAQEAYDELYENLSSNESSDSSEEQSSDSETKKPSENTSSSSESGFESPSNVLSAATSSDTPITESEVLSDVLEGNSEAQAQVGTASAKSLNIRTSSQHLANQIIPKLPSRRQLTKHYKLAKKRAYLGHTTIGSKVVLRCISSRPPGTHWMGTKSSVISGWIGPVKGDPTKIIFDSGSEITLISEKLYKSLNPKPAVHIGQGVHIIQVKGNTETKNYITVPLTFETPQGQVEMLVDAYIVPDMTTGFLLGNDFSNQYQLSLIRESNHSYVKAGSSYRQIPVIGTSTDPRTDSAGSFRVETIPLDTRPKRHKKSLKKALKQAPPGTVPVCIYKTITIAPESLMLVKVKTTFDMGQSEGYVERLMSSNCSEEDLFGITDCIISANNPKLQIANFSKFPVKLQAGRIIGYMSTSMNILRKEEESTEGQLHEFQSRAMWIKSVQKKEKIQPEPFDTSWSKQVEGGPKTAELPELEQTPSTKLLDEIDINPRLNKEQKAQIEKIVLQNAEAFGLDGRLGNYPAHVPIKLQDEDSPPIALTPYTYSPAKKEAIDKQIDDWLCLEVITESDSPWAFPVIVVYRNDKPRVCIDYRKLNERAIPDQFPLPKQTDILHALEGAQFLSTLDALAGFTQLTIKEEDCLKTAFRFHRGLFQFNRLPFGFLNGPSALQRVMQKVLAPFLWLFALVYIDDIVIYSKTFEEHLLHLDTIFKSIIKAGITLSPKKCHLGYQSLLLLGHKVSCLGLSTHKEKVEHILSLAPPKNVKELRTFAGLIGYFGNSIPFGAWILAVLFRLLRKSDKWVWGPLQQRAFELAKEALASAPVLAYPVVGMPYRLYTDASEVGLSGILQQVQYIEVQDLEGTNAFKRLKKAYEAGEKPISLCTPTPKDEHIVSGGDSEWNKENWLKTKVPIERVIAYWSRILSGAEQRYSATEQEALALKEALVKFQHYLEGAQFSAITDHSALTWARKFAYATPRLLKYSLLYSAYPGMTVIHRAGRVHDNADALSRLLWCIPKTNNPLPEDESPLVLKEEQDAIKNLYREISPTFEKEVKELTSLYIEAHIDEYPAPEVYRTSVEPKDSYTYDIDSAISYNLLVKIDPEEEKRWIQAYSSDKHFKEVYADLQKDFDPANPPHPLYLIGDDGLIYFNNADDNKRLCVPKSLRLSIMNELHNSSHEGAHPGYARFYNQLHDVYYWPGMGKDAIRYSESCDICQKIKPRRHGKRGFLQPIPIPEQPFKVVTLDFIMDLPESNGYNAILVIVDKLTRYAHFIPCTTKINEVETASLFRDHIWAHYGLPRQIISDRDSRWTGAFWDHLTSLLGIKRALTTAHHPQADGQTEIMNQTLEIMLRSYINDSKDNWSALLPALSFSYNTSKHSTPQQTPAFLLRGYELLKPSDLLANTSQKIPRIESDSAEVFSEEMKAARNKAKDAIRIAQIHQIKPYNSGRKFEQFQEGDLVLINL